MSSEPTSQPRSVITFSSRHSAGLSVSLSRFRNRWFVTYPRAYGMVAYPGQRIHSALNAPGSQRQDRFLWYNCSLGTASYTPGGPVMMASPIHMVLESTPQVARLTGRTRKENSIYTPDNGKEIECLEIEILIDDQDLFKQCAFCLHWEEDGSLDRFVKCGDDMYWCRDCQARGWIGASLSTGWHKLVRDTITPIFNSQVLPRDSIYT